MAGSLLAVEPLTALWLAGCLLAVEPVPTGGAPSLACLVLAGSGFLLRLLAVEPLRTNGSL